jgi:hypothetical protein
MDTNIKADEKNILELYNIVSKGKEIEDSLHKMDKEEHLNKIESNIDKLNKFKEKFEISEIGEGRDRMTFTSGSLVSGSNSVIIKVSKSDGTVQNSEEIGIWKDMNDKTRENVAKLYKWDNLSRWIIQERVNQITSRNATKELVENLNECGWTSSDIRPANVGERESTGHPVLMDLGVGLRRK